MSLVIFILLSFNTPGLKTQRVSRVLKVEGTAPGLFIIVSEKTFIIQLQDIGISHAPAAGMTELTDEDVINFEI